MKKFSYKILLFLCIAQGFIGVLSAQVTIGDDREPVNQAILELVSTEKGFLPPRVALTSVTTPISGSHVAGLIVYNTTNGSGLTPGLYYNDGAKWAPVGGASARPKWFYMPSIVIDVSVDITSGSGYINLYEQYKKQFNKTYAGSLGASQLIGSPGSVADVPYFSSPTDLYYYVTAYDATVFSDISINVNGEMSYSVNSSNVSDATFINIVFVEK